MSKDDEEKFVYLITPSSIKYIFTGTENMIYNYAKYLNLHGFKVSVIVPKYIHFHNHNQNTKQINTSKLVKFEDKIKIYGLFYNMFSFYFGFNSLITEHNKTIIYLPLGIYNNILNILFKFNKSIYVVGSHGLTLFDHNHVIPTHKIFERFLIAFLKLNIKLRPKHFDSIYFHTINTDQSRYLHSLGIQSDHIIYVPNFLDFKKFKINKIKSNNKLIILHIGGINKNVKAAVDLIRQLKNDVLFKHLEFHFIGKNQPEALYDLSKSLKNIIIHGLVDEKQKKEILSYSDVLLVPSEETFSLSALEGFANGLICIGINNWILRFMKNKVRGGGIYIVNFDDYKKVRTILENLLKDGIDYDKRKDIREVAKKEFDKTVVLPKIRDMFRYVAQN